MLIGINTFILYIVNLFLKISSIIMWTINTWSLVNIEIEEYKRYFKLSLFEFKLSVQIQKTIF